MSRNAIFLSASVPVPGRGRYYDNADPFLIQFAVREFVATILGRRLLVWGGHPAITPMVWAVCEDLDVDYSRATILYQSTFFEELYPRENAHFRNVIKVDHIEGDLGASLQLMRKAMFSQNDFVAAVFIGGMEGVTAEYEMFTKYHPKAKILPVASPGGAARDLAKQIGMSEKDMDRVDFSNQFHEALGIAFNAPRGKVIDGDDNAHHSENFRNPFTITKRI